MNVVIYITILMGIILGFPSTDMSKFDTASIEPPSIYDGIPQTRAADGAFVLGYPDAPITIVAFEDFLCPHCQNYQPEIRLFIQEYVATGQARFEFRMLSVFQFSPLAFSLVECADELEPGTFWDAHDTLFQIASTTTFTEASSFDFAERMVLPYDDLQTCLVTADQYLIDWTLASQYPDEILGTPAVAWRLNNGELRFDQISRRPSIAELGELIRSQADDGAI